MYSSYGLIMAILDAVNEGDQDDLICLVSNADPEVLADEIFHVVGTLLLNFPAQKRETLERRLIQESTDYDFETLVQNLQERYSFTTSTNEEGEVQLRLF